MSGERGMNSERRWARKKSKRVKPLNIDEWRVGTELMRTNTSNTPLPILGDGRRVFFSNITTVKMKNVEKIVW